MAHERADEQLRVSYAGVRGIYGRSLTLDVAARFAHAFVRMLSARQADPLIVLGKDTRASGKALEQAVLRGLAQMECRVVDIGVVPSPTLQVMMRHEGADGGLTITASHNPPQWNGFKFLIGPHHIILDAEQTAELFRLESVLSTTYDPADAVAPTREAHEEALRIHVERVLDRVEAGAVRAQRFRVAVDAAEGAGESAGTELLERLGCQVIPIEVARDSEPTAENLTALREETRLHRCAVGFAQDVDADRLIVVSETGEFIGEEYTLALVVKHLLEKTRGQPRVVVKNSATSRMVDDLAQAAGAEVVEVRVGEVNLSKAIIEAEAQGKVAFGGEGNGGVIYPPVCHGRDSLSAMALVLEAMAASGQSVSELVAAMPRYTIRKAKVEGIDRAAMTLLLGALQREYAREEVSLADGLKVRFADRSWLQVRPSNTEPVVRLTAESPFPHRADSLMAELLAEAKTYAES